MKIIILGAGQVGGTLAEHLASEANDITVVDTDGDRLRDLGDRLDIRTVQGRGSFPTVLRQAGADDADMLVAVTNSDETNMVACQVAYTLFHTPTKIARVRESRQSDRPRGGEGRRSVELRRGQRQNSNARRRAPRPRRRNPPPPRSS